MATYSDIDANTFSTTTPLTMGAAKSVGFSVKLKTGRHIRHIVTLQQTLDGSSWTDTEHLINRDGEITDIAILIALEVRAKVTRKEGVASTIDITIIVK